MRRLHTAGLVLFFAISGVGAASGDTLSPHYERADSLLIVKSERKLYVLKNGEVLRDFDIALGLMPEGPKQREGDFKTPEGRYFLEAKNPNSDYFLSVKISYPSAADRAHARAQGLDPGGQIMIHGQPNDPKYSETRYEGVDWTDGCVAVSNSDMVDIWLMTEEGTPIEIRP